jgi:autotransporter passenger strand-loop-strand repeat protein
VLFCLVPEEEKFVPLYRRIFQHFYRQYNERKQQMAWVNTDKDYNGETLTGGYLYIANGGTVRNMIVGAGGVLEIYTGGLATENQVAKAGRVMISGGTLEKTSVDAGFV